MRAEEGATIRARAGRGATVKAREIHKGTGQTMEGHIRLVLDGNATAWASIGKTRRNLRRTWKLHSGT